MGGTPSHNLPRQLTSFVGRDDELRDVTAALAETRLLTLTGAGGCGKTRLALETASAVRDRFPDGVWWVALATAEPALVGQALAGVLGVWPLAGQTPLEAAVARLAERSALVVFDNCEHLLEAAAEATEAILGACPGVTVLVTSRAPLAVPGETAWRVPSLSVPDAARLFRERARKVRPDLEADEETVARVCTELDGIPLAIELAAARARMLPVAEIADGLADRFRLLTGGVRNVLPRHRTLRASVDWSHGLLGEPERVLFRRLGVFAGGFTLDAAERVCQGDGLDREAILDLLASLVDKSMVLAEKHGSAARYRMLETVRQYAVERLGESGETASLRERHCDAYVERAESIAPGLTGAGHVDSLDALDPDGPNFTAALEWAADAGDERALRLCQALALWWKLRGGFAAAELGFARALAAGDPAPSVLRARVLWGRAYLLTYAGDYTAAIATAEAAREVAEAVGDTATLARALDVIGTVQLFSDPESCRRVLSRACQLAREAGDDWCLTDATQILAFSHSICDDYDESERLFESVLPLIERSGYREFAAWHWFGMSGGPLVRGEGDRMLELAQRAIAAARDVGEPATEASAHAFIAWLDVHQGRPEAALARLEPSRERVIASGAGMALPYTEIVLASARAAAGDLAGARKGLEPLVAGGADSGWALAWATAQLAELRRVAGEPDAAERHAAAGVELAERISARRVVATGKETLARVVAGRGAWSEADALLHDALAICEECRLWLFVPSILDAMAEVAAGLGSHEEAARLLGCAQRARADRGLARWAPDEPRVAALEESLRAALGEDGYAKAHAQGAALSLEEGVAWTRRARGSRKRPPSGWESLTATEARVVELVAEGLTNPQIGERMFISLGTVKTHLTHVFQKLAVGSRAELAAEAARRTG